MEKYKYEEITKSKVIAVMTTDIIGLTKLLQEASNGVLEFVKTLENETPETYDPASYIIEIHFAVRENPADLWGEKRHEVMGLRTLIIRKKEWNLEDN